MTIIQTNKPLQKRHAYDFYETPRPVCEKALTVLNSYGFHLRDTLHVLDPGCGTGRWGQAAKATWPQAIVDGVEIRDVYIPDGYRWIYRGDFCLQDHGLDYDVVIGNPPFRYAELFVRNALANLKPSAPLLYLLPLRFLEGKGRARGLFRHTPPLEVIVIGRVSFSGNKKTDDTPYALYHWVKEWWGATTLKWML